LCGIIFSLLKDNPTQLFNVSLMFSSQEKNIKETLKSCVGLSFNKEKITLEEL
jgi:hypothetical protein